MARKLKCSICQERRRPKLRRPAALPRARAFNDVVHGDLIKVSDVANASYWLLNLVDAASGLQVCKRVADKTSYEVFKAYELFTNWAGPPVTLVLDLGPEFSSEEFTKNAESLGSRVYHTPVEAPWQNGVAERNGYSFKVVLAAIVKEHSVTTADEWIKPLSWPTSPVTQKSVIQATARTSGCWVVQGESPRVFCHLGVLLEICRSIRLDPSLLSA